MKMPTCPHCDKLMIGTVGRAYEADGSDSQPTVIWICPEKVQPMDPMWVEVAAAYPIGQSIPKGFGDPDWKSKSTKPV
jgi:hypothetical protein